MELHLIQGKSPILWIKAILSYQWARVRIYTSDIMIEKTRIICDKLQEDTQFEIDLVITPNLNRTKSLREFCYEFEKMFENIEPVTDDVVLFYSGTMPQISLLISNVGYRSFMKYHSGRFTIRGSVELTLAEPTINLFNFFELQGYILEHNDDVTEIYRLKGESLFKSKRISKIYLTKMGKLKIRWRDFDTSGQRKKVVNDVVELTNLLGSHSIEHEVKDHVIEMWLKNINTPFELWSEEE